MQRSITVAGMCLFTLASTLNCSAETESGDSGKSSTGKISWEFRTPSGSISPQIWLWPTDHKDKAVRLAGDEDTSAFGVEFSQNDDWIVVSRHLSSGNFFSFYHRTADGSYEEAAGGGDDEPVPGFDEIQKTVPKDKIDRWTASFIKWDTDFGQNAFVFSWTARLEKGQDRSFKHFLGWTGVYDLAKGAIVRTLSPGKVVTETDLQEEQLNDNYRELRGLLDPKAKEALRLEELDWLKKRDAIKTSPEKLEFTTARADQLQERIEKLKK